MYGKKSSYLRRPTLAEVKAMSPEFLLEQAVKAMQYEVDIFYTGTSEKSAVIDQINKELTISNDLIVSNSPIDIDYKRHTRNKVFMIDDPKAVQSQIYFIAEGKVLDQQQRNMASVFNNYFGRGMASIIFQEIREFRSLAYSAYGSYINRSDVNMAGYYFGFIGTQVDKTMEAIGTYMDLFNNLPIKENRMSSIKLGLTQSINSRKPNWRGKGSYVANLRKRGYNDDPNKISYQVYNDAEFNDIVEFHKNNIKKDPIVITILTDKSKINIDKILDYGELIELKKENIFN
jgi:predicted Zn-dependent peptidase